MRVWKVLALRSKKAGSNAEGAGQGGDGGVMTLDQLIVALRQAREHSLDDIDGASEVRACLDSGAEESAAIMDVVTEDGVVKLMLDPEF